MDHSTTVDHAPAPLAFALLFFSCWRIWSKAHVPAASLFFLLVLVGLHCKITSCPASIACVLTMNGTDNENVLVVGGTVAAAEVTAVKAHAAT